MGLISIPTTFVDNTIPTASQFNGNFTTIANEINGSLSNANISGSAAISPTKLAIPSNTTTFLRGDGTFASVNVSTDGWTQDSTYTWVYASASTFTIASTDLTTVFTKGTRLRFKQGGSYKYYVVVSSSFSTNTTVTVAVNTDYTIANAAITDTYYSYQQNPQGFPTWFTFTTTHGGFSVDPTYTFIYKINGNDCVINYNGAVSAGTSNATSYTITLPVTASQLDFYWAGVYNNGTWSTGMGRAETVGSSATLTITRDASGTVWTNSGSKGAFLSGVHIKF